MLVYKVTQDGTIIEFSNEETASEYATLNECDVPTSEEVDKSMSLTIPQVTPRQMRQALVLSGISLDSIEAALDSLSEPTRSLAKVEWEYSIAFQRDRPLVAQMGAMLGLNSTQLDSLWIFAGTL